jgi:polyhydroxyalkanoate synthesis regulator phasin
MPTTRKRASTRKAKDGNLVDQARQAAGSAVKDLQKRLPPDLSRQLERSLSQGQKAIQSSLQQVQARLNRTASQTDVDRLTRRIDELTRQVNRLVTGGRGGRDLPAATTSTRARPVGSSGTSSARKPPAKASSGSASRSTSRTPSRSASKSSRGSSGGSSRSTTTRTRRTRGSGAEPEGGAGKSS